MILTGLWFIVLLAAAAASLYGGITSLIHRQGSHLLIYAVIALLLSGAVEIGLLLKLRGTITSYAAHWAKPSASKPGELVYVALGDSAAQGIGASSVGNSYVMILAREISDRSHKPVRIINLSKSGGKLRDVINDQLPRLAKLHPDIVTIDIGANDITSGTPQDQMIKDYGLLIKELRTYPVVFANLPDFMWGTQQRSTTEINKSITLLCEQFGVRKADLHTVTKQSMWKWNEFAPDGFHPSNNGHRTWASAFRPEINKILLGL